MGSPIDFISTNTSISTNPDLGLLISKNSGILLSFRSFFQSIFSSQLIWFITIACSLALACLIFIVGSSLVHHRFGYLATRKWRSKSIKHTTSWRFNSNQSDPSMGAIGSPFQSSKICINYYGGSNGDSEHDMVHSCSQSSHYEDFATNHHHHHQQALQSSIRSNIAAGQLQQQQQPIYLNGNPSLGRRPIKYPQACVGSGDASFGQLRSMRNPVVRANPPLVSGTLRQCASSGGSSSNQPELSATMRDSMMQPGYRRSAMMLGEVPLITGAKKSRIDLDQQQAKLSPSAAPTATPPLPPPMSRGAMEKIQPQIRLNMDQQTFSSQLRSDQHIYDDVIYNQMIM